MENYSANFEKTSLGIEYLDTAASRSMPEAIDSQWKVLNVNSDIISIRGNALVAAISMTELLIVGGMSQNATQKVNDGFVLRTTQDRDEATLEKVVETSFKFSIWGNQCTTTRSGKIVALVEDDKRLLHLVTFTKEESQVRFIQLIGSWE